MLIFPFGAFNLTSFKCKYTKNYLFSLVETFVKCQGFDSYLNLCCNRAVVIIKSGAEHFLMIRNTFLIINF